MNDNFEFKPLTKGLGFHKKSTFIETKVPIHDLQVIDHPLEDLNLKTPLKEKPVEKKKQDPMNFPQYQGHLGARPKSQIEFSVEKNIFELEKNETKTKRLQAETSKMESLWVARSVSVVFDFLVALFVWFTCLALLIYFFHIPLSEQKTWVVLGALFVASVYCFRVVVVLLLKKTFGEILTNIELQDLKSKKEASNFKAFQRANLSLINFMSLGLLGLTVKIVSKKSLDHGLGVLMNRNHEWQSKSSIKNSSLT